MLLKPRCSKCHNEIKDDCSVCHECLTAEEKRVNKTSCIVLKACGLSYNYCTTKCNLFFNGMCSVSLLLVTQSIKNLSMVDSKSASILATELRDKIGKKVS